MLRTWLRADEANLVKRALGIERVKGINGIDEKEMIFSQHIRFTEIDENRKYFMKKRHIV